MVETRRKGHRKAASKSYLHTRGVNILLLLRSVRYLGSKQFFHFLFLVFQCCILPLNMAQIKKDASENIEAFLTICNLSFCFFLRTSPNISPLQCLKSSSSSMLKTSGISSFVSIISSSDSLWETNKSVKFYTK